MKVRDADSRRRLAISAGAWALLMGLLMAIGGITFGLDAADVLETAVLGGLGAAVCIWFYAGDIIAIADRMKHRRTDRLG